MAERVSLAHLPTPLEALPRLGERLGIDLWVKRDDCTGLAGGGNKVRKLEFLCADALARGCDTLVTGGGRQSNHARATAAAARRLGLRCTLVLGSREPEEATGNVVLDRLLGADIVWAADAYEFDATEAAIHDACERVRAGGRTPYAIPIGGASAIGALGYVEAARELLRQDAAFDVVVIADGSGGTHAGLAVGLGSHDRVLGVDVGARPDLGDALAGKAREAAAAAGMPAPTGQPRLDRTQIGDAYGAPTEACREALVLAATLEALILDPVYTGKAMAGLIAACRDGRIPGGSRVTFLHTGGMPALFTPRYARWLTSPTPSASPGLQQETPRPDQLGD